MDVPAREEQRPAAAYLSWHGAEVFNAPGRAYIAKG